ncbi:MAG: cysteine desulfurase [Candidatus Neomarinimicrobiota bacterium]|nr:cysteine desulfurase [Candidatus Neomarinimicrobiota bacterium]
MNVEDIRKEFPILNQKNRGKKLIYFDSAATSLKPISVIETEMQFYKEYGASIHRSVYELGEKATNAFENTRKKVAEFIGSESVQSIVFTKSATESINLVADAWGFENLKKEDVILLTDMEHHSNIVPWQIISEKTGATIQYIKSNPNGTLDLEDFENALNENVKMVSITHTSNVFGTINPIKDIVKKAHDHGALVMVDGCQSTPHIKINVTDLDCDFFAFSGHKMFGPTGVGVLYAKKEILEKMPPYQTGGGMIEDVTMEKSTWTTIPHKFEPGSPVSAQVIGLGGAIDFFNTINHDYIEELTLYGLNKMNDINGITIYGNAPQRVPIISFNIENIHSLDIAQFLDYEGIAVRSGHHCCKPLMNKLGISSCVRISFHIYNDKEEIDTFIEKLNKSIETLS